MSNCYRVSGSWGVAVVRGTREGTATLKQGPVWTEFSRPLGTAPQSELQAPDQTEGVSKG